MRAMIAEKRTLERFSLQLLASVSIFAEDRDQEAIDLLTRNISSGGAFFETAHRLSVGSRVKIEIILPLWEIKSIEGDKALIKVTGSIIRTDEKGMAMCFDKGYQILSLKNDRQTHKKESLSLFLL